MLRWLKKMVARFLPGLLLAVILYCSYQLHTALQVFGTYEEYREKNGYHYAENALRKTGLNSCAYDAANTALYYDTYFRDGESLTVFVIDAQMRDLVWQFIQSAAGWHTASVTAQDYQQAAGHFRTPASMMRPVDDVVFDAFFYQNLLSLDTSHFADRLWENLPQSLGLSELPYTTDYRFAFYDQDTGLFICYDETM